MNSSVKRKRAGGEAISGSTKRQREGAAAWREELAEDEGDDAGAPSSKEPASSTAAPASSSLDLRVALGLSEEEEEIMDPGTPLPSEEEQEEAAAAPTAAPEADPAQPAAAAVDAEGGAQATAEAPAPAAEATPEAGGSAEAVAEAPQPQAAPAQAAARGAGAVNGSRLPPMTIWLEVVTGEDGDDERASEPLEILLREGLRPAVLERLAACMPPGRGAAVNALVPDLVCTFANHVPLKLPRHPAQEEAAEEPAEAATNGAPAAAAPAAASTNGKAAEGDALPEAYRHSAAGLLTAPRDAPGLALTLGPARQLDATHDVLGPVLLGRRVVQRLGALAPLVGGPAPAKPLSLRAVPVAPVEAPPVGEAAVDAPPPEPAVLKTAAAEVPVDSRPFLLEELPEATLAEELEVLGLDLDTRDAEVQELKQQVFSRERQEAVAALDDRLTAAGERLQDLESRGLLKGEGQEQLELQGGWLKERIRHLARLTGKLK